MGGNFIPKLLFALCIVRECWLHFARVTDLLGGNVQEGMLANVESRDKCEAGKYDLNNPPGDIVSRVVKLSLVFLQC